MNAIDASRIFGPAYQVTDEVRIQLDWRPLVVDGRITFRTVIVRGELRSASEFEIDLGRFDHEELTKLHSILSMRHSGTDTGPEVVASVGWLLERSLAQSSNLTLDERYAAVREMLLISARAEA